MQGPLIILLVLAIMYLYVARKEYLRESFDDMIQKRDRIRDPNSHIYK